MKGTLRERKGVRHMGGWQNVGPLLCPLNSRCRVILRTQKKTTILTTTHILPIEGLWFQRLYLVWFLEAESLNGQYMDPLGNMCENTSQAVHETVLHYFALVGEKAKIYQPESERHGPHAGCTRARLVNSTACTRYFEHGAHICFCKHLRYGIWLHFICNNTIMSGSFLPACSAMRTPHPPTYLPFAAKLELCSPNKSLSDTSLEE